MSTPAPIAVLTPQVANQIAAGEVVERPASVVKELVENALDAGATRIEVRLRDGGREQIRIVDNGHGIAAEQAELAFTRHATSKIRAADDLLRVASYGFRGEALASIASVAHVTMRTRTADEELGVEVRGDGSGAFTTKPVACSVGTDLRIDELFATVPARREFLRTAATELGHVIRWLDAQALARPNLHLSLHHNDRRVHVYEPRESLFERAKQVFGSDVAGRLHSVIGDGDYAIDGALAEPTLHRGSASGLTILVDGRPVSDRTVSHAVRQAYGNRLPARRHPVGVIAVRCPAATVDVNVHPMKTEVRFLSKPAVHAAVAEAVEAMLDAGAWLAADDLTVPVTRKPARPRRGPSQVGMGASDLFDGAAPRPRFDGRDRKPVARPVRESRPQVPSPRPAVPRMPPQAPDVARADHVTLHVGDREIAGRPADLCNGRFLLVVAPDAMHVVDAKAAIAALGDAPRTVPSTRLMIPLPVRLGAPLVDVLLKDVHLVRKAGMEVAASPEGGVLVRAIPHGMPRAAAEAAVRAIAGGLLGGWQGLDAATRDAQIRRAIGSAGATSAGSGRTGVLAALHGARLPATTPEGRPIAVEVSADTIDGWFQR